MKKRATGYSFPSISVSGSGTKTGTISWTLPSIPDGSVVNSCIITGIATSSMTIGSTTITINGTSVTSGSTFNISLGATNVSSVTVSCKGSNFLARGTVTFDLFYTVDYTLPNSYVMKDVVSYTFNNTVYDLFPVFNEGSAYDFCYEDVVNDTVTTRSIYADSLPTRIIFGEATESNRTNSLLTIEKMDTSELTSLNMLCHLCKYLTKVNCSDWNTSKVTNIRGLFNSCVQLSELDVSNWDTSNINDMYATFWSCQSITSLDVSDWDVSNVDTMEYMFGNCINLTELDLINWNTSKVTNMRQLFYNCQSLKELNINNWDVSNVIYMIDLFYNCNQLNTLDVSSWNTSEVTDMVRMFYKCQSLKELNISNWDTRNVNNVGSMFELSGVVSLDLSNLDFSKISNIGNFCCEAANLKSIKMPTNMNPNPASASYQGLFARCYELETVTGIENWDTSNIANMSYMFLDCYKLSSVDISNWNTSNVTTMQSMFGNCSKLNKVIMDNSDYNSVNSIISVLLTRTTDSYGALYIDGIDDISQVDITTAQSKYWNLYKKAQCKIKMKTQTGFGNLKSGGNTISIRSVHIKKI